MKRLILLFLLGAPFFANCQITDAALTTQNNNTIRGKTFNSKSHADMLKALIDSKVSVTGTAPYWLTSGTTALTGNATISGGFNLTLSNNAWTFGSRVGSVGTNSFTSGLSNAASGSFSHAEGASANATGYASHAEGVNTTASGDNSHAEGSLTIASGLSSHSSGNGNSVRVSASGGSSFNHSLNTATQIAGHGAHAEASVILGGRNHNINISNTNSVVLGGDGIKLGAGYSNFVVIPSLALWTTPVAGAADDVLVWDATDNIVKKVTQASLSSGGPYWLRSGTTALTGNATISGGFNLTLSNNAWTFGSRIGSVGTNSFTSGFGNTASGSYSHAEGESTFATEHASHAEGLNTTASGDYSHSEGESTTASGYASHSEGVSTDATGYASHSSGNGNFATRVSASGGSSFNHSLNTATQIAGHGAHAEASVILGGRNHNIDISNTNSVVLGGAGIKLGAGYSNFVVIPSLALWTTPVAGAADDVLVWDATDNIVKKVAQSSLSSGLLQTVLLAGTTLTLSELHRNKIINCTSASAVTITVPAGLQLGYNTIIMQDGAGIVTLNVAAVTLKGKSSTIGDGDTITLTHYKATNNYLGR